MSKSNPIPIVSGISPHQGTPGTQVTIRGENLGNDANDLVALIICGTDCLVSAKWKSSSKIIARVGQAKRGVGDIVILTRSGGRGISNVQFRVFIEEIGPLQESSVWIDESRSVPGRNVVRNIAEPTDNEDALGLRVDAQKKYDNSYLSKMFPERSGNLRLENFVSAWYLLENHQQKSLSELQAGLKNLQNSIAKEEETSKNLHKANLNALINCVTAMASLHDKISETANTSQWPMTKKLAQEVEHSKRTADDLFREVLSRKDYADSARNALSVLTRFRFIFFLAESIDDNMAKGEYSTILNDYTRAKSLFKDTDVALFKEVMVVLDEKIESVKQSIRQKLIDIPDSFETQSKLIKYLKILDPASDPAWDCITAYHCWLEDVLWKLQDKYHKLVLEEEQRQHSESTEIDHHENVRFSAGNFANFAGSSQNESAGYRKIFITELLTILTEKLDAFWKLSQSYSAEEDDKFREKRDDIDQMLKNTINVTSWLLLNALVPSSLPETVAKQYSEQFVNWPKNSPAAQINLLFFSLNSLRTSIKVLFEHQFTRDHVQPLMELSMTIRLKCLGLTIENGSEAVTNLAVRENWKMDVIGNEPKTSLPDLYVTEINEVLPSIKQVLSFDNFPGEVDLFSRERIRQMIIDLFVVLLLSFKDCCDQLVQLRSSGEPKRSTRLVAADSSSISSFNDNDSKSKPAQEITSRKLLITLCNVEFVVRNYMPTITRRLAEVGVKFCDVIATKATQKLVQYRHMLLKHYIATKTLTVDSLLEVADYDNVPDEEDVSDFVKELIMCVVFVQAELCLIFPQLTKQVLSLIIQKTLDGVFKIISKSNLSPPENATQAIIDLTALEEAFQLYLPVSKKSIMNSVRSRLMSRMDAESFQTSMQTFRKNLEMAIESLQVDQFHSSSDQDDLLSSTETGSSLYENDSTSASV